MEMPILILAKNIFFPVGHLALTMTVRIIILDIT
jgi:hypothetical protein